MRSWNEHLEQKNMRITPMYISNVFMSGTLHMHACTAIANEMRYFGLETGVNILSNVTRSAERGNYI